MSVHLPDDLAGLPVVETVPVADDYCERLFRIEDLGWGARFVLVTSATVYENDTKILVPIRKIVMPYEGIIPGVTMAVGHMARRGVQIAGAALLNLVK